MTISQGVFSELFQLPSVRSKYLNAPLLKERSEYILHLLNQDLPLQSIKAFASMQINAITLLDIKHTRPIHAREVEHASYRWMNEERVHKRMRPGKTSRYKFTYFVTKWLTFSGMFAQPEAPELPLKALVDLYFEELQVEGLSEATVFTRRYQLLRFQRWISERRDNFTGVELRDIDDYVDSQRAIGWSQITLRSACNVLRLFFRFCESRNLCQAGIARGILIPHGTRPQTLPRGPAWKDVKKMLTASAKTPPELREKAVVHLCSIYGLRRSEILQLRLDDLDWENEILTVRRSKRGRVQRFPLQFAVGEAILAYLKTSRPRSNCRNLFTTLRPPIRPIGPSCVDRIVASRMKALAIPSPNRGPHALRHSCATQLLDHGFSLQEIADFLGHRGLQSVSIYAKYNPKLLRHVAAFSLAEIQ